MNRSITKSVCHGSPLEPTGSQILEVVISRSQQTLKYRLDAHLAKVIAKWISAGNRIEMA